MSDLVSQNLNMIFKTPKGETVHALKDLNFTLKKGELLTVLGPSGCGKTTLLNIAAGFLRPTSGTITLGDKEINGPGLERGTCETEHSRAHPYTGKTLVQIQRTLLRRPPASRTQGGAPQSAPCLQGNENRPAGVTL